MSGMPPLRPIMEGGIANATVDGRAVLHLIGVTTDRLFLFRDWYAPAVCWRARGGGVCSAAQQRGWPRVRRSLWTVMVIRRRLELQFVDAKRCVS